MGKLCPPPERHLAFPGRSLPAVSSWEHISESIPTEKWFLCVNGSFPCVSSPMVHTTHRHTNMTRHDGRWRGLAPGPQPCSPPTLTAQLFPVWVRRSSDFPSAVESLAVMGAINSNLTVIKTIGVPQVESRWFKVNFFFFGKTCFWSTELHRGLP